MKAFGKGLSSEGTGRSCLSSLLFPGVFHFCPNMCCQLWSGRKNGEGPSMLLGEYIDLLCSFSWDVKNFLPVLSMEKGAQ